MADRYKVTLTSVDGGGSFVLAVGTIFPVGAGPIPNENGVVERTHEDYVMEGIFKESGPVTNFNKFYSLVDFCKDAGRVTVQIDFGATPLRTIAAHSRGPFARCSLTQRQGSLATHSQFRLEIFDNGGKDEETEDGKKVSNRQRARTDNIFDERWQGTIWTVHAEGDDAEEYVRGLEPPSDNGKLVKSFVQQVDANAFEATYQIDAVQKVGSYISWVRSITITEGGSPILEIPILEQDPILREGQKRAITLIDESTIQTYTDWIPNAPFPDRVAVFGRDPIRSRFPSGWEVVDGIKGIWQRKFKDFFVLDLSFTSILNAILENTKTPETPDLALPKNGPGWETIEKNEAVP